MKLPVVADALAVLVAPAITHAIIDLGDPRFVRGILIHNSEGYPERKTGVVVALSLDGQTWEQIRTVS